MDQARILVHHGLGRAESADLVGLVRSSDRLRSVASARPRQRNVTKSLGAIAIRIRLSCAKWPLLTYAPPSTRPQPEHGVNAMPILVGLTTPRRQPDIRQLGNATFRRPSIPVRSWATASRRSSLLMSPIPRSRRVSSECGPTPKATRNAATAHRCSPRRAKCEPRALGTSAKAMDARTSTGGSQPGSICHSHLIPH